MIRNFFIDTTPAYETSKRAPSPTLRPQGFSTPLREKAAGVPTTRPSRVLPRLLGVTPSAWVLAAATTNVEYTLTVTDTQTDEERVYGNPLGVQSPAITDTSAFATCP